jgi:hypothetical protein
MISGTNLRASLVTAALIVVSAFASALTPVYGQSRAQPSASTHDAKLAQQVMSGLASVRVARADFVEKKYVRLLNAPVESSGTLTYTAPDRFEKMTMKPITERMSVAGDMVIVEKNQPSGAKKEQRLFIGQHPALAAVVDGMRGALAGNLALLQQNFNMTATGEVARWRLKLVPSDASQFAYVPAINITGRNDFIDTIEIMQADGDRSVMTMSPSSASRSASQ